MKMRIKSCNSLQLRNSHNPLPPRMPWKSYTTGPPSPVGAAQVRSRGLVSPETRPGCTRPKSAHRSGVGAHPPGCSAPLDHREGAQRERQEGRLPGRIQRKARGGPFSSTPNSCSSASARGVSHLDPRRQKRPGRRSRPCKVQKRQILSARNPSAHGCPQVRARLGRAQADGAAAAGAPGEAGPGARRETGVGARGRGPLPFPPRGFRGSSAAKEAARSGPSPSRAPESPAPSGEPGASRSWNKRAAPAEGPEPARPGLGLIPPSAGAPAGCTGLRALCARRGGKGGRTLHSADGVRGPKPSPAQAPAPPSAR